MPPEVIQPIAQFGVAGLMGVLWVWERTLSRRREDQLDDTHTRLTRQSDHVDALVDTVRRNTVAMERFEKTQSELRKVLEGMSDAMHKQDK